MVINNVTITETSPGKRNLPFSPSSQLVATNIYSMLMSSPHNLVGPQNHQSINATGISHHFRLCFLQFQYTPLP